jgi:hypothetical protein
VDAGANFVIGKLVEDGGVVDARTVKEQILYEVNDPSAYLTPDVAADFSRVTVEELSHDRVRVAGAGGRRRPDTLKVTVALDGGLVAESGISYAGPGAEKRGRLAAEILRERLKGVESLRIDLIGVSSLHASHEATLRKNAQRESDDVRVRVAARTDDPKIARRVLWEVEALYTNGPAGGGGVRGDMRRGFVTHDVYLPREEIRLETKVLGP